MRLNDMIEIHKAQSCEPLDVLLSLSAFESTRHGKERALGLEGFTACLAIGGSESLDFLIGVDEICYSFKQARKRELGGHVLENADIHIDRIVSCLTNSISVAKIQILK